MLVVGTLLAAGLVVACASVAQVPAEEQEPQERRGCAFRGQVYAVGERWATGPPNKCAKYICEGDDQIAALTCPWFVPAPGCRAIPGDDSAVYPGCCPMRKCREPVPLQGHGQGQGHPVEASTASAPTPAPAARAAPIVRVTLTTTTDATTTAIEDEGEDSTETVFASTMTPPPA